MPQSRELANKKNDHKDRQSRGRAGSTPTDAKKGGAGAHNWGITTEPESTLTALDRHDPNYDSEGEGDGDGERAEGGEVKSATIEE